mgnify:CR=1 FL=1
MTSYFPAKLHDSHRLLRKVGCACNLMRRSSLAVAALASIAQHAMDPKISGSASASLSKGKGKATAGNSGSATPEIRPVGHHLAHFRLGLPSGEWRRKGHGKGTNQSLALRWQRVVAGIEAHDPSCRYLKFGESVFSVSRLSAALALDLAHEVRQRNPVRQSNNLLSVLSLEGLTDYDILCLRARRGMSEAFRLWHDPHWGWPIRILYEVEGAKLRTAR